MWPACPNQLAGLVSHDPGVASHQVAPAHWFLSMPLSAAPPPPTLTPNRQRPTSHSWPISVLRSPMSTLPTTSNSLRLTNKSRKNPLHPAPIRKPANQLAASGLHFPANSAPRPPAASPSPFLACWKPKRLVSFSCFIQFNAEYRCKLKQTGLVWDLDRRC